jgi:hypothetical protein
VRRDEEGEVRTGKVREDEEGEVRTGKKRGMRRGRKSRRGQG